LYTVLTALRSADWWTGREEDRIRDKRQESSRKRRVSCCVVGWEAVEEEEEEVEVEAAVPAGEGEKQSQTVEVI
jgi:hypothetical protein